MRPVSGWTPGSASASPGILIRHGHALLARLCPPSSIGTPARKSIASTISTKLGLFQDEWLRGGPVRRGCPRPMPIGRSTSSRPAAARASPRARIKSKTSASTTRCSAKRSTRGTFPAAPTGSCSARAARGGLRLAVEHLAQVRGGICFCIDLDPRWVITPDQAGQIRGGWRTTRSTASSRPSRSCGANHEINCMFTTPKLLEALCEKISLKKAGITRGVLRRHGNDAAVPPLRPRGVAGGGRFRAHLRQHADGPGLQQAVRPGRRLLDHLSCPAAAGGDPSGGPDDPARTRRVRAMGPRATDHFDEGVLRAWLSWARRSIRTPPVPAYPWDGVADVRPFKKLDVNVVEGVY